MLWLRLSWGRLPAKHGPGCEPGQDSNRISASFDQVVFDRTPEARIILQDVRASLFLPLVAGYEGFTRDAGPGAYMPLSREKEKSAPQ